MSENRFLARLSESPSALLSDGAMGTQLSGRGVTADMCLDELNLTQPARVAEVHRAYIQAGSQIIQTNTFGANASKLARHHLAGQVAEINAAGVDLVRRAGAALFAEVLIAGDVGPLGVRVAPYGRLQPEAAKALFVEQMRALAGAGVDLLILETFTDLNELKIAIAAAREVCALPVTASLTYTRDDRSLLGDSPAQVARALAEAGADVIGANCSGGPAQLMRVLKAMRSAVPDGTFSIMPNAGWPEQVGGRIMYPANPDYFGQYAEEFCTAGARLIGGCCGTTPEHIAAMRRALDVSPLPCPPPPAELREAHDSAPQPGDNSPPSHFAETLAAGKFAVSVEMDPPRGLSTHKLLAGAGVLAEAGADVINVADSPMARMRMSPWAVCDLLQRRIGAEPVLHFPTRGRNLLRVQGDLLAAHALGIRNVFVVMGDPTAIGDYPKAMDQYDLAPSGLIRLIKTGFNAGVDHAGVEIGQPTRFFVGCALNLVPLDPAAEIKNLKRKVEAGSDFILTQPVYQPERAEAFLDQYQAEHGKLNVPLLVGVMPLMSVRHAAFLNNEVPGIHIREAMMERLRLAGERAPAEGVRIAVELVEQMRPWAAGIYLMPQFHRYDLAAEIVEAVKGLS
jgi:homocysteine S-methyltransferase